jgi:hypothetical protein
MRRSLLWSLVFLVLALSSSGFGAVLTWDGGGSQAGNGRVGKKEADLRNVYRELGTYIDSGLRRSKELSDLTSQERRWLSDVRSELAPGHRRLPLLRFVSEKRYPEKFNVPGNSPVILWLDEKVGNELWISADFLDWNVDLEDKDYKQELAAVLVAALAMRTDPVTAAASQEKFGAFCQSFLGLIEPQAADFN